MRKLALAVLASGGLVLAACGTSNSDFQAKADKLCQQLQTQTKAQVRNYMDGLINLTAEQTASYTEKLNTSFLRVAVDQYNQKHSRQTHQTLQCGAE